ncbi:dTMP kinase [Rhodovulum imhoffii]|nr:dTMP kinase [Rhodovulum imhoffii]MBK5933327.1 dTMP kinase [Rhodovulum imhoffii]
MFVTLEGIDGTGKSTQSMALARALREMGREVLLTREPGGSTGAEEIRRLLLEGPPDRWSAETEILLFTAARRDHMEKTIQPALEAGRIVVCDRFADSTRVYQGITRGDLRGKVDALHDLMIGRDPDLTFVLDMPPDKGLARARARNNGEERFEDFGLGMQERMRTGFLELAQTLPHRCRVIDANRAPDIIAADIFRLVRRALP